MKTFVQDAHAAITAVVFDIDNTMYLRDERYLEQGTLGEINHVAQIIGVSHDECAQLINQHKRRIATQTGRDSTMTEAVYACGVTPQQWSELRCVAWQPDEWVTKDPQVCEFVERLAQKRTVVFATNSPCPLGERILQVIGLEGYRVFGPENLATSKPDVQFFIDVAHAIGHDPCVCIAIGDRQFSDIDPPLVAGYAGGLLLDKHNSRNDLLASESLLFAGTLAEWSGCHVS